MVVVSTKVLENLKKNMNFKLNKENITAIVCCIVEQHESSIIKHINLNAAVTLFLCLHRLNATQKTQNKVECTLCNKVCMRIIKNSCS